MRLTEFRTCAVRIEMGVRRVPINVRSLTGKIDGQPFESSLERDLMLLYHWNDSVDYFVAQPVKIEYRTPDECPHTYTPDLLVYFHDNPVTKTERHPRLFEVKYREDLAKDWKTRGLKYKFKAARQYARERGWTFEIKTEVEIRTPYLNNIQFLWDYRFSDFYEDHFQRLSELLDQVEYTTPKELLNRAYDDRVRRGEAMWTLWCMMARGWVHFNDMDPLTMNSMIWQAQ